MFGTRFIGKSSHPVPPENVQPLREKERQHVLTFLCSTALGASPAFFGRLRSWFRQTFVLDFGVAEILAAPVPVIAKEAEAKVINMPKPFTKSAARAHALPSAATIQSSTAIAAAAAATTTSSSSAANGPWVEMGPLTLSALRRQIRRSRGWNNLRRRHQMQATKEETTGLLAAVEA